MRYLIALILFTIQLQAADTTWVHSLPLNDNAASTSVTNNGTGAAWTSNINTAALHSAEGDGSFALTSNYRHAKSTENWTEEKIYYRFRCKILNTTAASTEIWAGNGNGDHVQAENEWFLSRPGSGTQFVLYGWGDGDGTYSAWTTTDFTPDNTGFDTFELQIDATVSPWTVSLKVNGTALTGAWDTDPGVAVFNSPLFIGGNTSLEPDGYFQAVRIIAELPTPPKKDKWDWRAWKKW